LWRDFLRSLAAPSSTPPADPNRRARLDRQANVERRAPAAVTQPGPHVTIDFSLDGTETPGQLIKQLVGLRHSARRIIKAMTAIHETRAHFERRRDNAADGAMKAEAIAELADLDERRLMLSSA